MARRNMRCLVAAGKHANDMRAIVRQPPITTIEKLLETVFSVGSARGYIARTPGRLSKFRCGIFAGQDGPESEKLKNLHC
jgi:hypothetical protein